MTEQLLLIVIEAAVRVSALSVIVGALLWLLRVPRGAISHSAWLMVVVGMLLMPGLQRLAPPLPTSLTADIPNLRTLLPLQEPPSAVHTTRLLRASSGASPAKTRLASPRRSSGVLGTTDARVTAW